MSELALKESPHHIPTIHIITDSVGETARVVARAVAAQFGVSNPNIETLSHVKSFEEIQRFLDEHALYHVETLGDDRMLVFYTLVDTDIRVRVSAYVANHPNVRAVDLLSDAVSAVAEMSGLVPDYKPGLQRVADTNYFHRVDALEFALEHDDGRNPQDLTKAEIVLVGVSRSSKTPLSIYLAQQGYLVANIPLDPETSPPPELADVDRTRLFGLMTTPDVLVDIRQRRLGRAMSIASSYADFEYVCEDLEKARKLMRKLGCIIIRTEKRAVEETAQEILRYYKRAHPMATAIMD